MRSGSISLLSFAALAASMADGAAIPSSASGTGSLPSSRRSSIASTSSTTLPASSSSTSTSAAATTTTAAAKGRPVGPGVFKDPFSSSSSTFSPSSTSTSSIAPDSTVSPLADPTPIVAVGRPIFAIAPAQVTSSSTTSRSSSISAATTAAAAAVGGRPAYVAPQVKSSSTSSFSTTTSVRSSSITTRSTSISSSPLRTSSISASSSSYTQTPSSASTSSPATVTSTSSTKRSSSATTSTTSSTPVLPSSSSTTVKPSSTTSASSTSAKPTLLASGAVEALVVQKTSSSTSTFTTSARPSLATILSSSVLPTTSTSSTTPYSTSSTSSSGASKLSSSTFTPSSTLAKSSTSTLHPTSSMISSSSSQAVSTSVKPSSSAKPSGASSSAFMASSVIASASQSASKSKAASSAATSATKSLSSMSTATKTAIAVATTAAAIAAAYMDFGCWQDSSASRTLTGPSYVDTTGMTQEACATFCAASGMPFSGTEYGEECYCSSTAPTSDNAWWCNMPCTGNSSETCGSGNALSVLYNSAAVQTPLVSTNLGCYADESSMRTMTGPSFSSSSMTNELCSNFCTAYSYPYSGTEYGSQCYCSDALPWSAPVGCSMPCAGNSSEICGDGNALAVTFTGNSSQSATSSTTNSTKLHTVVDMNQKYQDWSSWKARGVNLGNWLVLERWMYPSWFDATASGAVDEWTFCSQLGKAACTTALQQHWASWITGDDISKMASMGTNTLRIPVGFWAFVDPLDSEPYVKSTQLQELSRVLGLAAANGMTCIVDIHGLPGSQNGKDHSGHLGSVEFYSEANQNRSLAVVQAAATWVANSGYAGTTITALEVANEPAIADWTTWLQYKDYVLASHAIVQSTVPSVSTMFHDGFWPLEPWNKFFTSSDNAVLDTHKYWAFSPTTVEQATSDVCSYIDTFGDVNLPVFIGEFSLSVDADVADFVGYAQGFFQSQMAVWLQGAGAAFWSIKSFNDDGTTQNPAWSAEGILSSGVFSGPVWNLTNITC